ncbi:MAG: hypothetical protein V7K68_11675 [Nostoc sp.]|uniref:hypothetical protein n=1 Tax=Nostoc sp. TaxID=1180 RepID=UPI002FF98E08
MRVNFNYSWEELTAFALGVGAAIALDNSRNRRFATLVRHQLIKYVRCELQAFTSKFTSQPRGRVSNSYRNDPRNRYLQTDLLTLLKGDVASAKRLLAQQRRKNPGQSDNWYLEKVIYDLERDRR